MLVLTRRPMEKIYIGDDVIITVVAVDRNKVRIGIECPRDTLILREDLRQRSPDKEEERT